MTKRPIQPPTLPRLRAIVPPILGWQAYPRAAGNLLLFGLAVLGGEWLVHQLEYLIEYGGRFGTVMARTPHRFYMVQEGAILGAAFLSLAALLVAALALASAERLRLRRRLPSRLARVVSRLDMRLSLHTVGATAVALAVCQTALYAVQENVEWAAVWGGWPGLGVIFARQHITVLPLHLLVALAASLLLWAASCTIRRARHEVQAVRALVAVLATRRAAVTRLVAGHIYRPNLRLVAGRRCPRSPPLSA